MEKHRLDDENEVEHTSHSTRRGHCRHSINSKLMNVASYNNISMNDSLLGRQRQNMILMHQQHQCIINKTKQKKSSKLVTTGLILPPEQWIMFSPATATPAIMHDSPCPFNELMQSDKQIYLMSGCGNLFDPFTSCDSRFIRIVQAKCQQRGKQVDTKFDMWKFCAIFLYASWICSHQIIRFIEAGVRSTVEASLSWPLNLHDWGIYSNIHL